MLELYINLAKKIIANTRELKDPTGILGEKWFTKGLSWDRLRKNAMKYGV